MYITENKKDFEKNIDYILIFNSFKTIFKIDEY